MFGRAQPGAENLIRRNTGQNQLVAIRARDVEPQLRPSRRASGPSAGPAEAFGGSGRREPAVDEMSLVTGRRERIHEFGTNLITTRPDAGPDRNDEVRRPRAEL